MGFCLFRQGRPLLQTKNSHQQPEVWGGRGQLPLRQPEPCSTRGRRRPAAYTAVPCSASRCAITPAKMAASSAHRRSRASQGREVGCLPLPPRSASMACEEPGGREEQRAREQ